MQAFKPTTKLPIDCVHVCVFSIHVCMCICARLCVSVSECVCVEYWISVSLFDEAHSVFLFCVEPQEAVVSGSRCERKWTSHFRHFTFGVPLNSGILQFPFFSSIIIQWPVASRHTRFWYGCSGSFSLLLLILTSNCGTGTTSLALHTLYIVCFWKCTQSSHNAHIQEVEHQPVVPLLWSDFVPVQCNQRVK